jgi:hypothetical protein
LRTERLSADERRYDEDLMKADMAWDDPIVGETRALREQLMDEVGNDLGTLVKYLQERELDHPERLVSLPPRAPVAVASVREKKSRE